MVLVDDQARDNLIMSSLLTELGDVDSQAYQSREECLAGTRDRYDVDAYVVDLDLGEGKGTDGIVLIRELRERRQQTGLIIALSSRLDLREEALGAGADDFIEKTRTSSDALAAIRRALLHSIDSEEGKAREIEGALAKETVARLRKQFRLARSGKIKEGAVQTTLRQLLQFRYLPPAASQVLSALDQCLNDTAAARLSDRDYKFLARGIGVLEKGVEPDMMSWIAEAHRRGAEVILPWLDDSDEGTQERDDAWSEED
jgi:DNA-binding response OmpR family regulator